MKLSQEFLEDYIALCELNKRNRIIELEKRKFIVDSLIALRGKPSGSLHGFKCSGKIVTNIKYDKKALYDLVEKGVLTDEDKKAVKYAVTLVQPKLNDLPANSVLKNGFYTTVRGTPTLTVKKEV